jgi:hypothetical protein
MLNGHDKTNALHCCKSLAYHLLKFSQDMDTIV